MGVEIERKFLIDKNLWESFSKPKGDNYRQGYIYSDTLKTIRVRATNKTGFLTIKGQTIGISRPEFEYEIPLEEAHQLLDQFAETELSKTRYKVNYEGYIWEIDHFHGKNDGLLVAEIELPSENTVFTKPAFILNEVSLDKRYSNSYLSKIPFTEWP